MSVILNQRLACVAVLAVSGCAANTSAQEARADAESSDAVSEANAAPFGPRYVTLSPPNGTTSFAGSPSVFIATYESIASDLPKLEAGIGLFASPGRVAVATTFAIETVPGAAGGVRIIVKPTSPLNGEYTLRVAKLPSGYVWTAGTPASFAADGAAESTFSTASGPRIVSMSACDKATETKVTVAFSEPLRTVPASSFSIAYVDGSKPACTWLAPSVPSSEAAFACTLDVTRAIRLGITSGIVSSSGAEVTPADYVVNFGSIPANADACRVHAL